MAGDHHRSMNLIHQRPRWPQEGAEGATEGLDRRRRRTASCRRGPSPPTPLEEDRQPQEEVAPVDESDEELVRQTEEEEEEGEATGTGSASSDSSSSVYLRGPASLPQVPLPHQRLVIRPEGQK